LGGLMAFGQKKAPQRSVEITPDPVQNSLAGPYYALVIGNNNYQRPINNLVTAVDDARAVAKLLQQSYGFKPPKLLLNATRTQILTELYDFQTLPKNSNLLIYYAGHGTKKERPNSTTRVYWVPVDGQQNNELTWISASTIIEEIGALRSAHVLVISDSCFSGDLTRDLPVPQEIPAASQHSAYLRKMLESMSRTLMASGRDEPVADSGSGGHSKFAYVLLESLQRIDQKEFTAGYLFQNYVQTWVGGSSNQVPQYSVIPDSGHAYGDFVFSRSGKVEPAGLIDKLPLDTPPKKNNRSDLAANLVPDITCSTISIPSGVGPKVRQGDRVPCNILDEPLAWMTQNELPKQTAQTRGTATLTIMVDEQGHVSDIKPRGAALQGMDSWLKTAAKAWQTNQPTYKGMRVKSSFALDINFGQ
jgi:hypothetical protein